MDISESAAFSSSSSSSRLKRHRATMRMVNQGVALMVFLAVDHLAAAAEATTDTSFSPSSSSPPSATTARWQEEVTNNSLLSDGQTGGGGGANEEESLWREIKAILGGVLGFWGGVGGLGALFLVVVLSQRYCCRKGDEEKDGDGPG